MQLRGSTQIIQGSITLDRLAASLGLPTSSLAEGSLFLKKDGSVPLTADLPAGGFKITGLGTPTANTDAATKAYVDGKVQGLDAKAAVRVVSTSNIASLSGTQTVDGIALSAGDRVLLTGQTTTSQNGIWVVAAGAWTRPTDYTGTVTPDAYVFVREGTNADTGWVMTTDTNVVVDTNASSWTQFSSAGSTLAGNGLTKSGNTISALAANASINIAVGGLSVNLDSAASLALSATGLKIADPGAGKVLMGGASGAVAATTITGDFSLSSAGVATAAATILKQASYVANETLTGTIDGANKIFTLANTPVAGTLEVFINGLLLKPTTDYTLSGTTVTLTAAVSAPVTGDWISSRYLK